MVTKSRQTGTKVNKSAAKRHPAQIVRCLITGFDSFGKLKSNPSQRIVDLLPEEHTVGRSSLRLEIDTMILPTCCNESWQLIQKQLNEGRYNCLIMTGVAESRTKLHLERFALNIRDYRIKDNNGHRFDDTPIRKGEPDALRTGLHLTAMRKILQSKKFPVDISNFAGTFICNEVYYQALRQQKLKGKPDAVLFVHVPLISTFSKTLTAEKHSGFVSPTSAAGRHKMALLLMRDCMLEIAAQCASVSLKI